MPASPAPFPDIATITLVDATIGTSGSETSGLLVFNGPVSVPSGEPLCALAGCPHPQAVDSTMCPIHRDMGYRKAAEQMAGRIKAEAAMMTEPHQAVADALNNAIAAFDPDGEDSDQDCHFYATRTPTGTIEVKEEP